MFAFPLRGSHFSSLGTLLLLLTTVTQPLAASDWPQWRYDSARGAATPHELPAELQLRWSLNLPAPRAAWPESQYKLQFDALYEPVAAGGRLFVPSMRTDSVTAYNLADGEELWRFHAEGPVRFAPVASAERVWFISDDGCLYCLGAGDGKLLWKVRGGPSERRVLGNERLVSMWPARGGPVMVDGTIYFTAGVWPFMGIFVHAVEAETGRIVWTNSGSGSNYLVQPHNSPAFAGVSPQGYLAVGGETLLVAGGRTVPAGFDRRTGEFVFYRPGERGLGKDAGGYGVFAGDNWYANRGGLYQLESGLPIGRGEMQVLGESECLALDRGKLTAFARAAEMKQTTAPNRLGVNETKTELEFEKLWEVEVPRDLSRLLLRAGNRAYGLLGDKRLAAVELEGARRGEISWQAEAPEEVGNLLAAGGLLIATTHGGGIYAFGAAENAEKAAASGEAEEAASPVSSTGLLLPRNAVWRYLDTGRPPADDWTTLEFDDSSWASGRAPLGYGGDGEATRVGYGADAKNKHVTTWFRHAFEVGTEADAAGALLRVRIDDGAVFHLNGRELARIRMPRGAITPDTLAAENAPEGKWDEFVVDPALLHPGKHVLAVEVHQRSRGSSDIALEVEWLLGSAAAPSAQVAAAGGGENPTVAEPPARGGYLVVFDPPEPEMVERLLEGNRFHAIVLARDEEKIDRWRARWMEAGLYGDRVAVLRGGPEDSLLPPYFAERMVLGDPAAALPHARALFESLRPYGGRAVWLTKPAEGEALAARLAALELPGAKFETSRPEVRLIREGPLPQAGWWTHQNADVGNRRISPDALVRAPLGLLWFGGPSSEEVLPRHGHGPTPQVAAGRLVIEGPDMLRALDVYTGRLLWQRALPGIGAFYNNTGHHPGANAVGGNYVTLPDAIYVAYGRKCLRLNPATGETVGEFTLPADAGGENPIWGYVGVSGDLLIAGSSPIAALVKTRGVDAEGLFAEVAEGSKRIVVLDRHTGRVRWTREARYNFRHNTIAAGDGRLYLLDRMTAARLALLKRRGMEPEGDFQLLALDVETGEEVWSRAEEHFGTWLSYSEEHGLLVQGGSRYRDRAGDETGQGLAVYRGESGEPVWRSDVSYGGPPLINGDVLHTQDIAFHLLTGEVRQRKHPLTGQAERWSFSRNYGCNTAIGCVNLLTFRSAAAGYFDLESDGGTGNLGGFRAGCTSNLIPADGVLAAPDYTNTCTCAYQNQASLAMVHMPEAEMWTFNPLTWNGERIARVGINFGAPGDRRAENGTLWLDYPSVGGVSPDLPLKLEGKPSYFRRHAAEMAGDGPGWVTASGVRGARRITLPLSSRDDETHRYTVRLWFSVLPGEAAPEPFTVTVQGTQLEQSEPLAAAEERIGAGRRFEMGGVPLGKSLELTLDGDVLLSGVEVVREEE